MHIRFPFLLFSVIGLFLAQPARAFTIVPPERAAGHHDWRVDSKDGTQSYGVAGDRRETYIWFGAKPLKVRAPFFAVIACLTLPIVGLGAFIWRVVRRHENAA